MSHYEEALSWLKNNKNQKAFGARHFQNTADAIAAVNSLYAAGATRVVVEVEYDEPDRVKMLGGPYSDTLDVYGAEKNEASIFRAIGQLKPYFVSYQSGRISDDTKYQENTGYHWRVHWGIDEKHEFSQPPAGTNSSTRGLNALKDEILDALSPSSTQNSKSNSLD